MQSLLEHLRDEYLKDTVGQDTEALERFVTWAQQYLDKHRPAAINHNCELNYRLTLQGGAEVLVAPEYRAFAAAMSVGAVPIGEPRRDPRETLDNGSVRM